MIKIIISYIKTVYYFNSNILNKIYDGKIYIKHNIYQSFECIYLLNSFIKGTYSLIIHRFNGTL